MNLYSFGCSFSASLQQHELNQDHKFESTTKNWQVLLGEMLGVEELRTHATFGASNEWIWHRVLAQTENYEEGDYIIIQSTSFYRLWMIENRPEYSNFMMAPIRKDMLTKDQAKTLEMVKRYTFHEEIGKSIYDMFMRSCFSFGAQRPDLRILIIPAFHPTFGVTGCLMDICNGEFISHEVEDDYYKYHKFDPRINHMSANNHQILAQKIYNYFENNEPLDLTTGFDIEYITEKNYKILDS